MEDRDVSESTFDHMVLMIRITLTGDALKRLYGGWRDLLSAARIVSRVELGREGPAFSVGRIKEHDD